MTKRIHFIKDILFKSNCQKFHNKINLKCYKILWPCNTLFLFFFYIFYSYMYDFLSSIIIFKNKKPDIVSSLDKLYTNLLIGSLALIRKCCFYIIHDIAIFLIFSY